MPRPKKTIPCQQCHKDFTQARKDQRYCSAQCRFDHFFENRDSLEERLEASEKENAALKNEVEANKAHIQELMAQLQAVTIPSAKGSAKERDRSKTKAAAS
jgi:predicted RNase H-like nuclease (RuvC/YqgF family)